MSKLKLKMTAGAAATLVAVMSSSAAAQSVASRSTAACDTVAMLRDSTNVDQMRLTRLNKTCGQARQASSSVRIPITKG